MHQSEQMQTIKTVHSTVIGYTEEVQYQNKNCDR